MPRTSRPAAASQENDPLGGSPFETLRGNVLLLKRLLARHLAPYDLALTEMVALGQLGRRPRQPRILSEVLYLTPASITGLIDRLEERGWVERVPHPTDRRACLVRRTPAGERQYRRAGRAYRDLVEEISVEMGAAGRKALREGCRCLQRVLERRYRAAP